MRKNNSASIFSAENMSKIVKTLILNSINFLFSEDRHS